jgi:FAD/FMN-containing dehydrogenases
VDIIKQLTSILDKNSLLYKKEEIIPYSRDASFFKGSLPLAVTIPNNVEELSRIMKLCYENEIPVYIRGGGTSLTGASVPFENSIVISMAKFDKILELDTISRYVVAEAGVRLENLNSYLDMFGYFYPPDPASSIASTVGGTISTNAGGLRAAMYGTTKEWVLGMEVVFPNGEITRFGGKVLKRSLGYDLTALMIGSEGTLAVITKAILKIAPKPRKIGRILAYYDEIEKVGEAVAKVKEEGITPMIAEFMDKIALESIKKTKGISYPENSNVMLILDIASEESSLDPLLERAYKIINSLNPIQSKVTTDPIEMERIYLARKGILSSLLVERESMNQYMIIGDIVVPPSKLAITLKEIQECNKNFYFKISLLGHIGDGNIHITIFTDPNDVELMKKTEEFLLETGKIALKHEGSVSAEHGIGLEKKKLLIEEFKAKNSLVNLEIMKQIKKVFDPKNILNRGKLLE